VTTVPLKSLCQTRHGGTPSKTNAAYWVGSIPWVSPKDMKSATLSDASDHISQEAVENSATSVVPEKSILVVVRSGILAHSLPVAQAAKPLAFNQDIKALTPDVAKVDPDYLFWFIRSQEPRVLAQGVQKGATVHSLQSGFIENLQVPLPERAEQRRIVDLLSRAEASFACGGRPRRKPPNSSRRCSSTCSATRRRIRRGGNQESFPMWSQTSETDSIQAKISSARERDS